jgi:hypothetical protein
MLITDQMRFPGILALAPCGAAALVIACGGAERIASRILGFAPVAFIGRISYSLYLIHWPVAVFGRRLFPYSDPMVFALAGIGISIMLAAVCYLIVEQPVRRFRKLFTRGWLFAGSALCAAAIACAGGYFAASGGFAGSADKRIAEIQSYQGYDLRPIFREGECFLPPEGTFADFKLDKCLPKSERLAVMWGDSHMAHLFFGLDRQAQARGYALGQLTSSGCPPIIGFEVAERPMCKGVNDAIVAKLLEVKPSILIMGAAWKAAPREVLLLDQTLDRLTGAGIRIVLLGPGPVYRDSIPNILTERLKSGNDRVLSDRDIEPVAFEREAAMLARYGARPGVKYVSVLETGCPRGQCRIMRNGAPLYTDRAHLTPDGSSYFAGLLARGIFGN